MCLLIKQAVNEVGLVAGFKQWLVGRSTLFLLFLIAVQFINFLTRLWMKNCCESLFAILSADINLYRKSGGLTFIVCIWVALSVRVRVI